MTYTPHLHTSDQLTLTLWDMVRLMFGRTLRHSGLQVSVRGLK